MATFAGKDGVVKSGSDTIAEVKSFTINQTADTAEDTALGDTWRSHVTTLKSWDGEITCHFDDTDTNGQEALTVGSSITLNVYPEGDSSGEYELSGSAIITGVTITNELENIVERSFTFMGNGSLTIGTV